MGPPMQQDYNAPLGSRGFPARNETKLPAIKASAGAYSQHYRPPGNDGGTRQGYAGVNSWDSGLSEILKALDATQHQPKPARLKDSKQWAHTTASYAVGISNPWPGSVLTNSRFEDPSSAPAMSLYHAASPSPFSTTAMSKTLSKHKQMAFRPPGSKLQGKRTIAWPSEDIARDSYSRGIAPGGVSTASGTNSGSKVYMSQAVGRVSPHYTLQMWPGGPEDVGWAPDSAAQRGYNNQYATWGHPSASKPQSPATTGGPAGLMSREGGMRYPPFVYTYTPLAKPLAATYNPVLRASITNVETQKPKQQEPQPAPKGAVPVEPTRNMSRQPTMSPEAIARLQMLAADGNSSSPGLPMPMAPMAPPSPGPVAPEQRSPVPHSPSMAARLAAQASTPDSPLAYPAASPEPSGSVGPPSPVPAAAPAAQSNSSSPNGKGLSSSSLAPLGPVPSSHLTADALHKHPVGRLLDDLGGRGSVLKGTGSEAPLTKPRPAFNQGGLGLVPPTPGTAEVKVVQEAAMVRLSAELEALVDVIKSDMSSLQPQAELPKTKFTHVVSEPLPHLKPQQLLQPLLPPPPAAVEHHPSPLLVTLPPTVYIPPIRTPMYDRRVASPLLPGLLPPGGTIPPVPGAPGDTASLSPRPAGTAASAAALAVLRELESRPGTAPDAEGIVASPFEPRLPPNVILDLEAHTAEDEDSSEDEPAAVPGSHLLATESVATLVSAEASRPMADPNGLLGPDDLALEDGAEQAVQQSVAQGSHGGAAAIHSEGGAAETVQAVLPAALPTASHSQGPMHPGTLDSQVGPMSMRMGSPAPDAAATAAAPTRTLGSALSARLAAALGAAGSKPCSASSIRSATTTSSRVIDDIIDSAVDMLHQEELEALVRLQEELGQEGGLDEADLLGLGTQGPAGGAGAARATHSPSSPGNDVLVQQHSLNVKASDGAAAANGEVPSPELPVVLHPYSAPSVLMHEAEELAPTTSGAESKISKQTKGSKGKPAHNTWHVSDSDVEGDDPARAADLDDDLDDDDDDDEDDGTEYMDVDGSDSSDEESSRNSGAAVMPYFGSEAGSAKKAPEGAIAPARTHPMGSSKNDVMENGVRVLGQKYEMMHVVGEGAYGMVMKCTKRGTGQVVAIKEFKIEDDDPDAEDVKRTSRREVQLLRALQHPHVVKLMDDFYVRDRLFIVMEFVPCNLLELLEAQPGGMDREAVRLIMYQLCTAITYIHSKGVVYRDIKPENLLVDEQGKLKLCDFGFARFIAGPEDPLTDYVATRWYRAPELLLGAPFRENGHYVQSMYGCPVDMWAIGCLMGELADGEPLFAGESDLDQLYKIQSMLGTITAEQQALFDRNPHNNGIVFNIKGDPSNLAVRYEGKMNEVELDFMAGLLRMDPNKRLTGQQCLEHPYLNDLYQADMAAQAEAREVAAAVRSGAAGSGDVDEAVMPLPRTTGDGSLSLPSETSTSALNASGWTRGTTTATSLFSPDDGASRATSATAAAGAASTAADGVASGRASLAARVSSTAMSRDSARMSAAGASGAPGALGSAASSRSKRPSSAHSSSRASGRGVVAGAPASPQQPPGSASRSGQLQVPPGGGLVRGSARASARPGALSSSRPMSRLASSSTSRPGPPPA